jgi:acyl-CoA thioesterase FadM
LRALEARLYEDAARGKEGAAGARAHGVALPRYDTVVRPEWVDYNGHMSDFIYGHVFGQAMDALYRSVGLDEDYRKKGRMFYTVESHIRHLGEAKVNEPLYVTTQVLALDEKHFHMVHKLYRGRDNTLIATGEQMHLHVDTAAAKATPMNGTLRTKLESLRQAHAALPAPEETGKPVGSRAKH